MICNIFLQIPDLSQTLTYTLFLSQIFSIGLAYNLCYMILEKRTKPEHLAIAIELNCCAYMLVSMLCPFILQAPKPIPCVIITLLCIISISTAHSIGPISSKKDQSMSKNFENTVYSILYQHGSVNETLDEGSSINKKWKFGANDGYNAQYNSDNDSVSDTEQ